MDYKKTSEQILTLVGGTSNIESFTNCMTRLRINVIDTSLVDNDKIGTIDGVMGVVRGQQTQIIFGPGTAQRMKDAFALVANIGGAPAEESDGFKDVAKDQKAKIKAKQNSTFQRGLAHIGNVFIPVIPGFIACGIITAIANIWKTSNPNILQNQWFLLFAALGNVVGVMLNIIVGYNSGKEFGGTPILGAIAGALIYLPALNGIIATDAAAAKELIIPLLNIKLSPALGGVLGVIFAAFVFATIEKQLRKIVPAALDLFLVPFLTTMIGGIITLALVMPIAAAIMKLITYLLVDIALVKGGIVGGYLLAASFLPLVMLGIHQGLTPVHTQLMDTVGYTVLLPILAMAGAGQVGMAIAVYFKTKSKKLKSRIATSLPIGILGVGEPLIYGVSLPLFYPFITACLGAGFGGAVIAFAGNVGAEKIGPSGAILIPLIANGKWPWYVAGLLASYAGGFILTYLFGYNDSMLSRLETIN